MNSKRKLLCLAFAMALAAFALPGMAAKPTKTYSLAADTSAVTYHPDTSGLNVLDVPAPITINIKNESPPSAANSNISSFTFTVTGVVITSVDTDACTTRGGICSLDTATNTVSVTNISPPVQAQETFPVGVETNSCGDGTWSAQVWSGSQLNGTMFGVKSSTPVTTQVSCGQTACGFAFTVPNSLVVGGSPTEVAGIRGDYNKDGSTCSTIDYFATNALPTQKLLHFEWDTTEPTATFRYTLNFPPDPVTNLPVPVMPTLSWHNNAAGPVFVAAQPCFVTQFPNNLPAPYGTLAQDVNSSKTKISVDVTTAPTISVPFPIIVGSERMQVTAVGPSNWTVMRGQGGTHAVQHTAGSTTFVMSTPRPLLIGPFDATQTNAGYKVGDQAHGCIASPDISAWPSTTYDVIDIDDIWTLGR